VWSERKKEHYHVYWDNITDPNTPEWRGREQPGLADLKKVYGSITARGNLRDLSLMKTGWRNRNLS